MTGTYRTSFNDDSNAPETEILGGTDQTKIGNVGDRLKVSLEPCGTDAVQGPLTLTASTVVEAKVGLIAFDRSMITIRPKTDVYIYFSTSGNPAPSFATLQTDGIELKKGLYTFTATADQTIYLGSETTTSLVLAERA